MKIYVASSWRNERQPDVVDALRAAGHEVFDFRHPQKILPNGHLGEYLEGVTFDWKDVDPDWKNWSNEDYIEALSSPIPEDAFHVDHGGMEWSDAGVLVLPCGASAHTELGYYDGANKPGFVLLPEEGLIVELMYKSFTICPTLDNLLECVNARDPEQKEWRTVARVCLDIEVEITLSTPRNWDEAETVAREAVETSFAGVRTGCVSVQQINSSEVYCIERQKE